MKYKLEEIEQQLIDTLKGDPVFNGVKIRTHAGQLNASSFQNSVIQEGLIQMLPFVFVQYLHRTNVGKDSTGKTNTHELRFSFLVGAKSLTSMRDQQKSCYELLRNIFDAVHGKWIGGVYGLPPSLEGLAGQEIVGTEQPNPPTSESKITLFVNNHGRSNGDYVYIRGCEGLTSANNTSNNPYWEIYVADKDSFTLKNSLYDAVYTGGGKVLTAMTSVDFQRPMSPFLEAGGTDERLIVNLPEIKVYSTDYVVRLIA